ncbi:TetR family transcriptional regulator [Pontibacterium granulatum]|uniref:TetR family transcriptional regulator n=1 Tax=Pontibacterium granulatum TaxID=2036029 RepID=UPI002499F2C5|nr:TetR family transcriptional regulator [Pontibacterium granulatum]MDI3324333.1 TetR family transcriptional regulator [Pontibacterium granulatum]
MARRTKEQAEQTKQALLDTALEMFSRQGISQTSLKSIAAGAEVTHGALYWHFKNRTDLVETLYEERALPLEGIFLDQLQAARQDALVALRDFLLEWFKLVVGKATYTQRWQVFYMQMGGACPELEHIAPQLSEERNRWRDSLGKLIKKARKQKLIPTKTGKQDLVVDNLLILIFSLINTSLTTPALCKGKKQAEQVIDTYLQGMRV